MKGNQLLALLLLIATIVLGGFLWSKMCPICDAEDDVQVENRTVPAPAVRQAFSGTSLSIADNDYWQSNAKENLMWTKNQGKYNEPLYGSVVEAFDNVKGYFTSNPKRTMELVGHYGSDETNTTSYENLGVARAESLKAYLIGRGHDGARLTTSGKLVNNIRWTNNETDGAMNYIFGGQLATNDVAELGRRLGLRPITVYFNTGESDLNLTNRQEQFIVDMIAYCKQVPDAQMLVEGHTDNVGNAASNKSLSASRAGEVKEYLVRRGVGSSNIETAGLGQERPIASNDTDEGKAQNRRVEISLKK